MSTVVNIEVRYRPEDTPGAWSYQMLPPNATTVHITGVSPSTSYRVEARSISSCGAKSAWVSVVHTVNGVPDDPDAPSGLQALRVTDGVALSWSVSQTPPTDVYFEVWMALETTANVEPTTGWTKVGHLNALSFTYHIDDVNFRWYKVRSRTKAGGASTYTNSVRMQANTYASLQTEIQNALQTALDAQAASDHVIESFYQDLPPTTHSYGDIWFDTNDTAWDTTFHRPKAYRWLGTSWVLADYATDSMVDAIYKTYTAQATADGKVQTFFQSTAPAYPPAPYPISVGDLWFNTSTKKLLRWDGFGWTQNVGDVTVEQIGGNGKNILFDEYTRFDDPSTPPVTSTGGTATRDTTQTKFGTASLKLVSSSTDQQVYFGTQWADIPMDIGTKFIFSMYVRSSKANAVLQVGLFDSPTTWRFVNLSPTGAANTWTRVSAVIDTTPGVSNMDPNSVAARLRVDNDNTSGVTSWIDGLMLEPMVGNNTTPSPWTPGVAGRRALIAIANAAVAQATADGKIETYFQTTPPTIHGVGDLWFDTDDGNKIYTWNGTVWNATPDSRIAQAIADAAGAQATADGKVQTFYQSTTPVYPSATVPFPIGVGDLWYHTQLMTLYRWNGSTWNASANVATGSGGDGDNLLPNASFIGNLAKAPLNTEIATSDPICDGWQSIAPSSIYANAGVQYTGSSIRLYNYGTTTIATGTLVNQQAQTINPVDVVPLRQYRFKFTTAGNSFNGTLSANLNIVTRMTVIWKDAANATISYQQACAGTRASGTFTGVLTAPSNARKAYVRCEAYIQNNTGLSWSIASDGGTVALNAFFTNVSMVKLADYDDEIDDTTTTFRRFDGGDGFVFGGSYRLGLRFGVSGHQFGDARNIRRTQNSSYISVRTTTALSATSAGAVSVLAHTIRYGGVNITYSAVTNAVTGLTQGATYVIYCIDPAYAGGVQTYHAVTSPEAAMNISPDVVIMGQITIPTSGTSSGGGGGGGSNPGDWCVDIDTMLPDGRYVRDLIIGEKVLCWNLDAENPGYELVSTHKHAIGEEESFRLVTTSGASIIQSQSTPMELRDRRIVRTPKMLGEDVLVLRDGKLQWEEVVELQPVGVRKVVKLTLKDSMYFAGETSDAMIATHNTLSGGMKP